MTLETKSQIADWGYLFIQGPLPVLIFIVAGLVRIPVDGARTRLHFLARLAFAVIPAWYIAIEFNDKVVVPVCIVRAQAAGDDMYDGCGSNAAELFLGWILPLATCLATAGILAIGNIIRNAFRKRTPSAPVAAT